MKVVRWSYNNLHMPMMQDGNGELWCTSKQLCEVLGITDSALRELKRTNPDEFEFLSVTKPDAKDFLTSNKVEFGIKRVRKDMTLWSEDDMITVAVLSRSEVSRQFRRELRQLIKHNAKHNSVSQEETDRVLMELGRLTVHNETLERLHTPGKQVRLQVVS